MMSAQLRVRWARGRVGAWACVGGNLPHDAEICKILRATRVRGVAYLRPLQGVR